MTNMVRLVSYLEPSDKLSSFYQDPVKSHTLKKKERRGEKASNRQIFNESSGPDGTENKF